MKTKINLIKFLWTYMIAGFFFLSGCSTQKDAWPNRAYHQLNTKYNALFYAEKYLDEGIKKIEKLHKDDYKKILEINKYGDIKAAQSAQVSLDQAIEKSKSAIQKHSMEIKGEEKNKLIDRSYMVIGKAQFYKKDYTQAINTLGFLARKASKPETQTEALLWSTLCHQEQNNREAVRKNIIQLEEDFYLDRRQDAILDEIQADIAIQEKYYAEAVHHLQKVLKKTKNKDKKIRIHYILGQINLLLIEPNFQNALKHFNQVIKKNPAYELAFNAKLMRAKTYKPETSTGSDINTFNFLKSSLEQMIRDDKNIEYRDQIYFALGNLALKNLDTLSSINYLTMSTKYSAYNVSQKLESHWLLARLLWDKKNYIKAYHQSDSAYQLSNSSIDKHNEIKKMRRNAKKVAVQYNIINKNDSIIDLARLPEKERNDIIDKYIKQLKEAEQAEKLTNERPSSNFNSYEFNRQSQNSMNISSGGGWYFYNPSAISLGYSEFLSRWGNRQLEDDWRRKNKNQVIIEGNEEELIVEGPTEKQKYNREYYIDQLPLTEEKQLLLLNKIETAYYDLGRVFKEELENYAEATLTYNELITRFPLTDYRQLVYFDLHNIYRLQNDSINSQGFLNKIEQEYPNSIHLRMLQGDTLLRKEIKQDNIKYNTAYNLYTTFSKESCNNLKELMQNNMHNPYIAKIELMNAFCQAQKSDKKTFINALKKIGTKYPETTISNKIDTIVKILKGELDYAPQNTYINEFDSDHYFFLTIEDVKINLPELQSSISKFNNQNYRLDSLGVNNLLLSKEVQLLRVGAFKNKEKALAYYELIQEDAQTKNIIIRPKIQLFVISSNNYKILLKEKNIADYLNYFNKIYLLN